MEDLNLINTNLLSKYLEEVKNLQVKFDGLEEAEISTDNFSFYTSVASVFSSKIEGEDIELDSYIKHKGMGMAFKPDYTKKIDDLYQAYTFAKNHELNPQNIAVVHQLLAKNFVAANFLGKYRTQNMFVATEDGRIEYIAVEPHLLSNEMDKFYADLSNLTKANLSIEEVFYFAAYLHLVFLKIHPWIDGNGRSARLLEKWFIAHHLGEKAWFLLSEKYYYLQHQNYYSNIRKLGIEYEAMDYQQALPFLMMLPQSFDL